MKTIPKFKFLSALPLCINDPAKAHEAFLEYLLFLITIFNN